MKSETLISIFALIISIISFIRNENNNKRELRIHNIHNIIKIIHSFESIYYLFWEYSNIKNAYLNNEIENLDSYKSKVSELTKISLEKDIQTKLSELYVLNNTYLPNSLIQDKISILITVYTSISHNILVSPYSKIELPFEKFLTPWDFSNFCGEIYNSLSKEMNLGYNNNFNYNYEYEEKFKEKYNLK